VLPYHEETLQINWMEYKKWDLIELTRNYLLLLLNSLKKEGGILVHCISGWDRTPLFISLLRISLWADEAVHVSLSCEEILYLTIAYDWFLFRYKSG
jgi:myotubularin-related protein 14